MIMGVLVEKESRAARLAMWRLGRWSAFNTRVATSARHSLLRNIYQLTYV